MSEKEISNFLREVGMKVASLKEARRLYGSQIAPDFYIFDYLRDDEMGLSRCIGNLLHPNGKHGQGDVFLKQFLIQINQLLLNASQEEGLSNSEDKLQTPQWDFVNTEYCKVKLEQGIDNQRRIDISLTFADGAIIGIENKPWAGDQKNQLQDYARYIKNKSGGMPWLLIYLCNGEPSEESIPKAERLQLAQEGYFITINYNDLTDWLIACVAQTKALVVRTFIEELIKYIRKDINGEIDMSVANEVKNIILQGDNFETAMLVSKTIDDAKGDFIAKLKSDLTNTTQKRGYKLIWKESMDSKWSTYSGFGINFDGQQSFDFELWFEFGQPNLKAFYWGIRRKNNAVIYTSEHWKNINNVLSTTRFGSAKPSSWWPWWVSYELDADFKNWETNIAPWNAIKNGDLVQRIMDTANEVHQHFINSNKLDLLKAIQPLSQ